MCGRSASERSGLRGESIWETGGGQKLFSNSFSHRTELTTERSNPFHGTCIDASTEVAIDPSTKVATIQSPSRPPLIRTYPLSEMLLCWGPSFFKIPDEFYWEQSPCKLHLQSPSKLHLTHSGE